MVGKGLELVVRDVDVALMYGTRVEQRAPLSHHFLQQN